MQVGMYRVQFRATKRHRRWAEHGAYGDENEALSKAATLSPRYFMVRVTAPDGRVLWAR